MNGIAKSLGILLVIGGVLVLGFFGLNSYIYNEKQADPTATSSPTPTDEIISFQDCVDAGNPVMESYPRQCRANGQLFIEDIGNELELQNQIRVENPRPNDFIASPLEVVGTARGTWFFEGSFSVTLFDGDENEMVTAVATSPDDWMTEEFIPFKATLEFSEVTTDVGTIVLEKANPSGLPENAESLTMPIRFR